MLLKCFTFAFVCLLVTNAMAGESTIPANKKVIKFKTKIGFVTFKHEKHANLNIAQCTTCHHKNEPADTGNQALSSMSSA